MCRKLMVALKDTKIFHDNLIIEYYRKANQCYENGERETGDYWNERAYQVLCENERIDMDIRKLKEEAKGRETNFTTR